MILPCPACSARFMVPDERITPKGIKIRCPKCRFVFIMKAQQKQAGPTKSASGAIGGRAGGASGSIGEASGAIGAASGSIGGAAPAEKKKPKPQRRAAPEGEAKKLSDSELAALEEEEIMDMDDLVQATEQSGTAFNPNIKDEHFQLAEEEGPSVQIDDSLMAAAADHKASWTEEPTAPENAQRIDPKSLSVSDTWIDLPGTETPTPPLGIRRPVPAAAPEPKPAAAEPAEPSVQIDDAFPVTVPTQKPAEPAGPSALDSVIPAAPAADESGEEAWPGVPKADESPAPATPAGPGALDSVIPSAPAATADDDVDIDIDIDDDEPMEGAPATEAEERQQSGFRMAYTLTAASTISAAELAELDEYEGLLVEERKALRKGSGAVVLTIIAIVGGVAILGTLGWLGWQALNPPKKKPPSWGHLQLSGLSHDLVETKAGKRIVKVDVTVSNGSKNKKFKNVHVSAAVVDASGKPKCRNWAPCGLRFKAKEIPHIRAEDYHKRLKRKTKVTAFKVELIAGEQEKCQILLFCGDVYQVGSDKIKVEIDKTRSERLME